MTSRVLPDPKAVRDLLLDLLGRNVEVATADPYGATGNEQATFGVYVDDKMHTLAVVTADLELSAFMGAAIGLVPVGGAEVAIEDRKLSQMLEENLYEVLNICASLLNAEGRPHVKLHAIYAPGTLPPNDVPVYAQALGNRLDLTVTIAGYGAGRMSFVGLV
jgi:hypothetical protein